MRTLLPELYGNGKSKEVLCFSIQNKKMPQTLILEGDEGSGRKTFAKNLAKALFCASTSPDESFPCGKCRGCERVDKGLTPDIVFIRPEDGKASVSVAQVREMTDSALVGPCEMPALVFIIEEADKMTVQAQNAWLLALENPPEDVVYILLCENSAKLLETIRSRSFVFRTEKFKPEEISSWIKTNTNFQVRYSDEKIDDAASAADGRIGRALSLLSENTLSEFHAQRETVLSIARIIVDRSIQRAERLRILYSLPLKRNTFTEQLVMLKEIIHDIIILKLDDEANLSFFTTKEREDAINLSDSCSLRRLYKLDDIIGECILSLQANASVSGVRTSLAVKTGIYK